MHRLSCFVAASAAIALAALTSPAAAQNGFSFADASSSQVHFAAATVRPQMPCAGLLELSTPATTILSAVTVARC